MKIYTETFMTFDRLSYSEKCFLDVSLRQDCHQIQHQFINFELANGILLRLVRTLINEQESND